ncbi:LPD7 domain-containing protein [Bradyrhizobium sp. OHSU_III]|uniref:LPD7 domain-containing protein n=1 Tax=Bradyrhizobium sp. OHSU_III TaxID=1297865 RepID=UPI0004185FD8|nr:LPD7 domain-containing protein [Bradyrhizobium sp. OHSU_III]
MNGTRDDSEDFSLERQGRAGDSNRDKGGDGDSAAKSAPTIKPSPAMVQDDVFPDRIRRKYYVVANESGKDRLDGEARLYADERGEYLAFKVTEDRLITRLAAAEVIRDMVSVAQHRQWEALHVRGSVEFRREAWLEAGARGIEVQGYQPTDLDRQALSDRQEIWNRTHPRTHEVETRSVYERNERTERLDYDKGVSGRLIEVGQAPYRNRNDAETSAYVAIELENGRRHQVWGVGLEKATADSKARPGDRVQVRRDGVDRVAKDIKVVDSASGTARLERRQVPRNRWRVTAEKFRSVDRQTAARDPDLVAAQSQMVIIEKALERAFPEDEHGRRNVIEAVRERIAHHLEHGHSFARATVLDSVRERRGPETAKEEAHHGERVRTQKRER